MRQMIVFAVLVMVAGAYVARFADRNAHPTASTSVLAAQSSSGTTNPNNSRGVTLSRDSAGHFWTDARIDGRRLQLVVDTGASAIALRASDAAQLGIHPAAGDYTVNVSTANGTTRAALVRLEMVEVGDIVVRDVPALIQADDALGVNLLGMTFLSRVRWTHDRGKLILEQ